MRTLAASRSTKASWIGRSTSTLRAFMQIWPWWKNPLKAVMSTAWSTSASASISSGL